MSNAKFVREIPMSRITDKAVNDLEQFGFTLVWKEDSLEVWANI